VHAGDAGLRRPPSLPAPHAARVLRGGVATLQRLRPLPTPLRRIGRQRLPVRTVAGWGGRNSFDGIPWTRARRSRITLLPLSSRTTAMPGRNFLFVPGPTNVPDRILRAMHRAMEDHRSSAFPELTTGLLRDLKKIFKTATGQPFIFPATGTGGWEAALVNTLSPGDRVISVRLGQFSHLWIDLAQRHGLRVDILDVEWGEGAPVERIEDLLTKDKQHEIKGVLIVQNETATGVTNDVGAVRRAMDAAQHPALLYVDGVSSVGSIDFRMDEWRVDLAITGSQKGLMLPAGLGIVCASPKALAAREHAKCPRVFFDFGDMIKANATGHFPYTPALS